ncbi:hypothetical protein GOB48_22320 [Sinorhizobium meliloti]|nr:hypothetical protein [Sinorhizobium meliloti]
MAIPDLDHNLHRQTEAAKSLLSSLREQGVDDDAELVADAIEGETNLLEAIEAALAQIDECDVLITGLKAKEEEFETRRKSIERRAERVRALIEQAMLATDQTSLKLPTATLSLTKRAPGLIVVDEADIPAKYWVEQPRPAPKLDKKALTADLREAKAAIPGATLDNGSFSLTVRRK